MLSCKDVSKEANNYIDNNMSMIGRIQLKIHLFLCVNCRNYVTQLKTTIGAIKGFSQAAEEASDEEIKKTIEHINKHLIDSHNHDNKE